MNINFDFSAFLSEDAGVTGVETSTNNTTEAAVVNEVTVDEIVASNEVEVTNEIEVADTKEVAVVDFDKMTMDEKIDYWIELYKDEPKVVYNGNYIFSQFDEKTNELSISNKVTGESIVLVSREFFEDVVFSSNTRKEKEEKLSDKFKDVTGESIYKVAPKQENELELHSVSDDEIYDEEIMLVPELDI